MLEALQQHALDAFEHHAVTPRRSRDRDYGTRKIDVAKCSQALPPGASPCPRAASFREPRHRRLARRLIAVGARAVLVRRETHYRSMIVASVPRPKRWYREERTRARDQSSYSLPPTLRATPQILLTDVIKSALAHYADSSRTFPEVREVPILLQKYFDRPSA
jgi:hypothetical protein